MRSLDASRIALIARVRQHAIVFEVTERGVELQRFVATRHVHVILLAQRGAVSLFRPVVRQQQVTVHHASQRRVRVQLTILTDQVLPIGIVVDVVRQATSFFHAAYEVLVSLHVCIVGRELVHVVELVVECAVLRFVILSGILDIIVVDRTARIGAPLRRGRDDGFARLRVLRCDDDHAVGTACTVEGSRSGVFQYGDRLHVGRVDVVPTAVVRSAVDDDQRARTGVDGADTAEQHGRRVTTSLTRATRHLEARHLSGQGLHHVRSLLLGQCVGIDHGGRTRKGRSFGGTISHDEDLIQLFGVVRQDDLHPSRGR